jgi:hypothetical protein
MVKKETKKQVISIMEEFEDARNSDVILMVRLWQKYYYLSDSTPVSKLVEIMKYSQPTSIIRIRSEIQNAEGRMKASDTVQKLRGTLRKEYHDRFSPIGLTSYHVELNRLNNEQSKLI